MHCYESLAPCPPPPQARTLPSPVHVGTTVKLIALLLRHGIVAPHTLLGLFGLESFVLTGGLEMSHSHVVPLTITGPHLLNTVKGSFLSPSVPPLAHPILLGVPLFVALPWFIHGPVRSSGPNTRPRNFWNGLGVCLFCLAKARRSRYCCTSRSRFR